MSKENFFKKKPVNSRAEVKEVFALKVDEGRQYTLEHMQSLARRGKLTEAELLNKFILINGGTMEDVSAVINAINDDTDEREGNSESAPEPVTTIEEPEIIDEDGNKIRAALFFEGKTFVTEARAREEINIFGIDPSEFAYHKYAIKNGEIIPGSRLPGRLGDWKVD